MRGLNITAERMVNQHLARPAFERPGDVVRRLGAVQAQDYLGSLWAIGLRTRGATEGDVERAIAERSFVRTWPMRGTLHFVPATDVRWMLKLLTPRVVARSAGRYRELELDGRTFARCGEVFVSALRGGRRLTRAAMYEALESAHISTAAQRGLHILSRLAQDGLICFGPREGKQPTFALLDEWVPAAKPLSRDESLAELARRYFESRGPATLRDFVWWSGLTMTDARAGLEAAAPRLLQEVIGGQTYWLPTHSGRADSGPKDETRAALLLPVYDEYTVAYRDRGAALNPTDAGRTGNGIFRNVILIGGRVVGTWRRALKKAEVVITPSPLTKFNPAEARAVSSAAKRYGDFLGVPAALVGHDHDGRRR